MTGITSQEVDWILDADIVSFFDELDHDWMMRFLEHRIADKRKRVVFPSGIPTGLSLTMCSWIRE